MPAGQLVNKFRTNKICKCEFYRKNDSEGDQGNRQLSIENTEIAGFMSILMEMKSLGVTDGENKKGEYYAEKKVAPKWEFCRWLFIHFIYITIKLCLMQPKLSVPKYVTLNSNIEQWVPGLTSSNGN
ncbi:MAG TPA: hypothetical protein DCZ43_01260 [candidate division Zixibacteria bacterium]|nr:hypothetical protein [candidate division Zixibacteria bacterium]